MGGTFLLVDTYFGHGSGQRASKMDGQREGEGDAHICGARIADTHTFQRRRNRQDRTAFFHILLLFFYFD
jgi:hypothetical protein